MVDSNLNERKKVEKVSVSDGHCQTFIVSHVFFLPDLIGFDIALMPVL